MFIQVKLTEKEFINVSFVVVYSKIFLKFFTVISFLALIYAFIAPLIFDNTPITATQIITPCFMLFAIPLVTYFTAKRNFTGNKRISETIDYDFDPKYLLIKGDSFNSQMTWEKIYKVTQTKNWVLIWTNRQIANPIPKRCIWDAQISELKEILTSNNVKNNL